MHSHELADNEAKCYALLRMFCGRCSLPNHSLDKISVMSLLIVALSKPPSSTSIHLTRLQLVSNHTQLQTVTMVTPVQSIHTVAIATAQRERHWPYLL